MDENRQDRVKEAKSIINNMSLEEIQEISRFINKKMDECTFWINPKKKDSLEET